MAYNVGGPSTVPRAHRPRAPIMTTPPPLTAPLAPLRPPPPVTLAAPRPEVERVTNEYVETPFRAQASQAPPPPPPRTPSVAHRIPPTPPLHSKVWSIPTPQPQPTITKQPTHSKASVATAASTAVPTKPQSFTSSQAECHNPVTSRPSIMCEVCNKCRCVSCQSNRQLPQRWVCRDSCLLSADTLIDYCSCLCCVKGVFYHFGGESDEQCADSPCSCVPSKRSLRWGTLTALSVALPCLWLYWPLRGCKRVVEVCYAQHSRSGCRCPKRPALPEVEVGEKRLLTETTDF